MSYFQRHWFMICLMSALVLGWTFHAELAGLAKSVALRNAIVASVLFLMALPLQAKAMWRTVRRPLAPLVGTGINFGLVPLLAFGASRFFSTDIATGILVAAAAPSTLASASVWTRRAEGNDSISMMITIVTNLLCFLATPALLVWTAGVETNSESLSFGGLASKLLLLVVCPMALAQILRTHRFVAEVATARKKTLGILAQMGLLSIVAMGAIRAGETAGEGGLQQFSAILPALILAVLTVHLAAFYAGLATTRWLGLPESDQIAVAIGGSQKTLMVGLHVSIELGVSPVPMILYHTTQLVADAWLADRWREKRKVKG
jgi:solute carrier family 10 (sodium/bile acid cotransporter), member 7